MSERPSAFRFQVLPTFGHPVTVELSGGNLFVSLASAASESQAPASFQATPSGKDWLRFWKAMDFLELWNWQSDYTVIDRPTCDQDGFATEELSRDGVAWVVEISHGNRRHKSQGTNSYPAYSSPSTRSDDPERLVMFISSLERLIGRSLGLTSRSTRPPNSGCF